MPKPLSSDHPAPFQVYIEKVSEDELLTAFSNQFPVITKLLSSITEEKSDYAYDTGKWTLKELLQHIIDTERIFNYRALCIARKESASLPGFDENDYAENSNGNSRKWNDLVDEFLAVRRSTEFLYKSFTDEMLKASGLSNNKSITVNSLGFTTVGHFYHHKKIIEERYLS